MVHLLNFFVVFDIKCSTTVRHFVINCAQMGLGGFRLLFLILLIRDSGRRSNQLLLVDFLFDLGCPIRNRRCLKLLLGFLLIQISFDDGYFLLNLWFTFFLIRVPASLDAT